MKDGSTLPAGNACEACYITYSRAFGLMTWEGCAEKAAGDAAFAEEFQNAKLVLGGKPKDFNDAEVRSTTRMGCRVERSYIMLDEKTFHSQFGLTPKEVALPIDTLIDPDGNECKGVLLQDSNGPVVRVTTYSETYQDKQEAYMPQRHQLRKAQAGEVHAWLVDRVVASRPKALRKHAVAPRVAEVRDKVEAWKKANDVNYFAKQPKVRALTPLSIKPEPAGTEGDDAESDDSNDDVEELWAEETVALGAAPKLEYSRWVRETRQDGQRKGEGAEWPRGGHHSLGRCTRARACFPATVGARGHRRRAQLPHLSPRAAGRAMRRTPMLQP